MFPLVQSPLPPSLRAPKSIAFTAPSGPASSPPADNVANQPTSVALAQILDHYRIAVLSRQVCQIGQREVFSGHAKFGAFGAGKELAQLALAHVFRPGDFRAGYYRDQTLMLALGLTTPEAFFAQLYANADVAAEPASGGRSMVSHFATR